MRAKRESPVMFLGPEERWKKLGIAIVQQAILDWREASLKLSHIDTANRETLRLKNSAEAFLKSSMCEFYSGCDGPTLLRKLKEGVL